MKCQSAEMCEFAKQSQFGSLFVSRSIHQKMYTEGLLFFIVSILERVPWKPNDKIARIKLRSFDNEIHEGICANACVS